MNLFCNNVREFDLTTSLGGKKCTQETKSEDKTFFQIREKQKERKSGEKTLAHMEVLSAFLSFSLSSSL